jgi:hypothetical protein
MVRKPESYFPEDWSESEEWWQFPMGGKPQTRQEWSTWVLAWLGFIQVIDWGGDVMDWLLRMLGWPG